MFIKVMSKEIHDKALELLEKPDSIIGLTGWHFDGEKFVVQRQEPGRDKETIYISQSNSDLVFWKPEILNKIKRVV